MRLLVREEEEEEDAELVRECDRCLRDDAEEEAEDADDGCVRALVRLLLWLGGGDRADSI